MPTIPQPILDLAALADKAKAVGVDVKILSCARCAGTGTHLEPDPFDLQVIRERSNASIYGFAAQVVKPDGTVGISPGFVKMVENPNPEKGRKCPEWLLAQYLEIPSKAWPTPRKLDPYASLRDLPVYEARKIILERRAKNKERQELTDPIRKGQIWERAGTELRFEVVQFAPRSVIIRRVDLEKGIPKSVSGRTLRKNYRLVQEAA